MRVPDRSRITSVADDPLWDSLPVRLSFQNESGRSSAVSVECRLLTRARLVELKRSRRISQMRNRIAAWYVPCGGLVGLDHQGHRPFECCGLPSSLLPQPESVGMRATRRGRRPFPNCNIVRERPSKSSGLAGKQPSRPPGRMPPTWLSSLFGWMPRAPAGCDGLEPAVWLPSRSAWSTRRRLDRNPARESSIVA
jgi:hypothetical protein